MPECDYCGDEVPKSSGKMFVRTDGSRFNFCSSKCEKNWEKDRNLEYAED
ncbi:MAG: 50S ribosomal protein L24e [Candidatus Nanohaloarchaeota archaeon QJJ-7]|nr:50S ribosomal protein L24e [Candidatus Nanohaloarchaeota archaeon QJJ-7]